MVDQNKKADQRKNLKRSNITQLALGLAILVLINLIGYFVFTRFDLTTEKRFTLSETTKKTLKELKDVVLFKVYLEGEFPTGYKRLHNETREMLEEFRAFSSNIRYEFIDPSSNPDKKERNALYQQLVKKGVIYSNIQSKKSNVSSQQLIFPGLLFRIKGRKLLLTC